MLRTLTLVGAVFVCAGLGGCGEAHDDRPVQEKIAAQVAQIEKQQQKVEQQQKMAEPASRPPEPSIPAAPTSTAPLPSEPKREGVLTPRTSKDLRSLLKVSDNCDRAVGKFASKYEGRTIRFNGSVVNLMNNGDYKTRYNFLIGPGSQGRATATGPALQFENVAVFELNLKGTDTISEDDRFQFTAKVGEFNEMSCLLRLEPVKTEAG